MSVDGPPGKVRAQVDDDGTGCILDGDIENEDMSLIVRINTYADEVAPLIAGQADTITASDHTSRSIVLNAATLYITQGSDTWYSTAGTLAVTALPTPKNNVHVDVNVNIVHFGDNKPGTMKGTIDATYIGAVRTGSTKACASLPDVPTGLVL